MIVILKINGNSYNHVLGLLLFFFFFTSFFLLSVLFVKQKLMLCSNLIFLVLAKTPT